MYFPISASPLARIFMSTHSGRWNPKHQDPHEPVTVMRTLPPSAPISWNRLSSTTPDLPSRVLGVEDSGGKIARELQRVRESYGQKLFGILQNIKLSNPLILRMGNYVSGRSAPAQDLTAI